MDTQKFIETWNENHFTEVTINVHCSLQNFNFEVSLNL